MNPRTRPAENLLIVVKDDTLREGMQTPGLMFSFKEKTEIATALVASGLRRMVVSYGPAHKSEAEIARTLVRDHGGVEIFSMGRTVKEDIDAIASTGANLALTTPFDGTYEKALDSVKYAKETYPDRILSIGLIDIGAIPVERLVAMARAFDRLQVDVLELPDTTGRLAPREYGSRIRKVKESVSAKIGVHCHNDHGMAIGNAIAGIEAGADEVDGTVLGLGERNGIADLAIVVDYLELHGISTGIDAQRLRGVYEKVAEIVKRKTGLETLDARYPVFGSFLGIHTAGTHATNPEKFAGSYSVSVYCGRKMISEIASHRGIEMDDATLSKVVALVKDTSAEEGRCIGFDEVVQMAQAAKKAL